MLGKATECIKCDIIISDDAVNRSLLIITCHPSLEGKK